MAIRAHASCRKEAMYLRSQAVSGRAAGDRPSGDYGILGLFERLMQEVSIFHGESVGVSRLQKVLRLRGHHQVARQVDILHRARKLAAHPTDQIIAKVLGALAIPVVNLDEAAVGDASEVDAASDDSHEIPVGTSHAAYSSLASPVDAGSGGSEIISVEAEGGHLTQYADDVCRVCARTAGGCIQCRARARFMLEEASASMVGKGMSSTSKVVELSASSATSCAFCSGSGFIGFSKCPCTRATDCG